jgi:minor curlin subunit
MKRSFFLLLATSVSTILAAQAQLPEPSNTSREQQLAETVGLDRLATGTALPALNSVQNVTGLLQIGTGNAARIDQQNLAAVPNQAYVAQIGEANILNTVQFGSNNRLLVNQNGGSNTAGYTQNGKNNATAITQNGFQNKIQGETAGTDFLLDGDNNTTKITQLGDNNVVKGQVRENNRIYEIRQQGSNNTLTQIESSAQAPKGYTVEMRGQGINLTIEQGTVR